MRKFLNRGISPIVAVAVIFGVIIIGGVLVFQYFWQLEKNIDSGLNIKNEEEKQELIKMFPEKIGEYFLYSRGSQKINVEYDCQEIKDAEVGDNLPTGQELGLNGEVCGYTAIGEYRQSESDSKVVHIQALKITKGADLQKNLIKRAAILDKVGSYDIFKIESHEIAWFSRDDKLILTQEYSIKKDLNGGERAIYSGQTTGNNPVTQYFLKNYIPVK